MVGLVIGVVCVAVMTLLLLGISIVEPKLIHYYDVGVVCAVCFLALCVSVVCVAMMVLLLLGTSIVEPKLIIITMLVSSVRFVSWRRVFM